MEYTKAELMALAQEWETLRVDLKRNKKMDFAQFNAAFNKTYTLLSQSAVDSTVDRALLPVIAAAVLFAGNDNRELDNKFRAALTLTERMKTKLISYLRSIHSIWKILLVGKN